MGRRSRRYIDTFDAIPGAMVCGIDGCTNRAAARKGLVALWADGTVRPLMFSVDHPTDPLRFMPVIHDEAQHRVRAIPDDEPGYLGVYEEDAVIAALGELLVKRLVAENGT